MTTSSRVNVRWPRPQLRAEAVAAMIARRLAGAVANRTWRHAAVPEVSFGVPGFAIPIVAGHVVEFLRQVGTSESEIEKVVAGDVSADRLVDLYRESKVWVIAQVEAFATLM